MASGTALFSTQLYATDPSPIGIVVDLILGTIKVNNSMAAPLTAQANQYTLIDSTPPSTWPLDPRPFPSWVLDMEDPEPYELALWPIVIGFSALVWTLLLLILVYKLPKRLKYKEPTRPYWMFILAFFIHPVWLWILFFCHKEHCHVAPAPTSRPPLIDESLNLSLQSARPPGPN